MHLECDTREILHSRFLADFRVYLDCMNRLNPGAEPEEFDRLYKVATQGAKAFRGGTGPASEALQGPQVPATCQKTLEAAVE